MDDLPRRTLRDLIAEHGSTLADDSRLTESLLQDFSGGRVHKPKNRALVAAAEEGLAVRLRDAPAGEFRPDLLAQLADQLQTTRELPPELARWSVGSWALALGVASEEEVAALLATPAVTIAPPESATAVASPTPPPLAEPAIAAESAAPLAPPAPLAPLAPPAPLPPAPVLAIVDQDSLDNLDRQDNLEYHPEDPFAPKPVLTAEQALRQAVRAALVDGSLDLMERSELPALRDLLKVSPEAASRIFREVKAEQDALATPAPSAPVPPIPDSPVPAGWATTADEVATARVELVPDLAIGQELSAPLANLAPPLERAEDPESRRDPQSAPPVDVSPTVVLEADRAGGADAEQTIEFAPPDAEFAPMEEPAPLRGVAESMEPGGGESAAITTPPVTDEPTTHVPADVEASVPPTSIPAPAATIPAPPAAPPRPPEPAVPTCVVSTTGLGDTKTISEAIRRSAPGTRVLIRPGTYRERIVLDRRLELVGDGPAKDVIVEQPRGTCLEAKTDHAFVRGLTFRQRADTPDGGGGEPGFVVEIGQGQVIIEQCAIEANRDHGVRIQGVGTDPTLRGCTVQASRGTGVVVAAGGGGLLVDNEIRDNGRHGVDVRSGGHPTVRNNQITGSDHYGVYVGTGGGGTFEGNRLRLNAHGAWFVAFDAAEVTRVDNDG